MFCALSVICFSCLRLVGLANGKVHACHLGVGGKSGVKLSKREGDLEIFYFCGSRKMKFYTLYLN